MGCIILPTGLGMGIGELVTEQHRISHMFG